MDLDWKAETGLTIQNPILTLDCQSQFNPLNWIAIQIKQYSNTLRIRVFPSSQNSYFYSDVGKACDVAQASIAHWARNFRDQDPAGRVDKGYGESEFWSWRT